MLEAELTLFEFAGYALGGVCGAVAALIVAAIVVTIVRDRKEQKRRK